ncbi:MAG: type II secretion system protein GspH [Nitrospirae bacterium GWD2_57_9]|nr:MAG: type II secretion system protein GspH [Nitrospirae bacterium GWD2_57_9]OGW49850.1 MAG: type II secretion system protein GspH [Nitrospirae bacterium GWC2_57_9]
MRNEGQHLTPCLSSLITRGSRGFTLIEIVVVIAILAIMITLIAPRLGEIGEANLKRSARHLTGMIRFLHEEAQVRKKIYRLMFDIQDGRYWAEVLTQTSDNTQEFRRVQSALAGEGSLSGQTTFRDIKVTGRPDETYMLFTPDGWVEHTMIHLRDGSEDDFTLFVKPLTGNTELLDGYVDEKLSNGE